MADKPDSSTENRLRSPYEWDFPPDGRDGSMVYPQFDGTRTRSGHVLIFDDTKDREHITLQHRTGTMFQFLPDGALHIVAHKGQFIQVFGESRVKITGAQDITVDGDASMKVKGAQNYDGSQGQIHRDRSINEHDNRRADGHSCWFGNQEDRWFIYNPGRWCSIDHVERWCTIRINR
jgi:hypothetical protein